MDNTPTPDTTLLLPAALTPPTPLSPPPAPDSPEYPAWLCLRVGQKLKVLREAKHVSAMALAGPPGGLLSDEAILNNEKGKKNPGLATLARHAQKLKVNVLDLMAEIKQELPSPP